MNSKIMNMVMIGIVVLFGLLTIATTFLGDSLMKNQSNNLLEVKLKNKVLENEQQALALAISDLGKYSELHEIAKQIVPSDKDQAKTTRELVKIAQESGINIANISFPSSDLGTKKPAAKSSGESESEATTSATSPISQAKPATGIPGLYQLEINLASDTSQLVTFEQLIDFLDGLENNRRTSHVTSLSIQPNPEDNLRLSFTITVTVYIRP